MRAARTLAAVAAALVLAGCTTAPDQTPSTPDETPTAAAFPSIARYQPE